MADILKRVFVLKYQYFSLFLAFHNILNENMRPWSLIYLVLICVMHILQKNMTKNKSHAFFEYVVKTPFRFLEFVLKYQYFSLFLAFHNILNENMRPWSLIYLVLICVMLILQKNMTKSSHMHFSNMS